MKRLIFKLLLICILCSDAVASVNLTPIWNTSIKNTIKSNIYPEKNPIAVDGDGNVYVTGIFDTNFKLGDYELKSNGISSFLAKYDRRGNVKWAIALTGSATITQLELSEDGLVYIAGQYAGDVMCGSVKESIFGGPLQGAQWEGEYSKYQNAAFVLSYSTDGVLCSQWQYLATPIWYLSREEGYCPKEEDIFFRIQDMAILNDDVYISAYYAGSIYGNYSKILDGSFQEKEGEKVDLYRNSIF